MTSSSALNGSLTHEPDRFSDAAWDLLLSGQDVARRWRHEQLDVEHLIQVLFTDPACRRLVERLPLPIDALLDRLEDVLADQPSGRGAELFIGDDLEQLLDSADAIRRRWNGDVIDGEGQALHQAAAGGIGEQHLNQVLHIQLPMAPATGNVLTTEQQIPGRVAEAIRLMGEAAVQRWR